MAWLNSNIRCIEIEIMSLVADVIVKLNSNIRCIEIMTRPQAESLWLVE